MFKVDQTTFGGKDAPLELQGNCFQACVATVLQMPLEEAFDSREPQQNEDWVEAFNVWLEKYGLGCIYFEHTNDKPIHCTPIKGVIIAECMSETLYNGEHHVVVANGNFEVLHDPNPYAKGRLGEMQGFYAFISLEPSKLIRIRN